MAHRTSAETLHKSFRSPSMDGAAPVPTAGAKSRTGPVPTVLARTLDPSYVREENHGDLHPKDAHRAPVASPQLPSPTDLLTAGKVGAQAGNVAAATSLQPLDSNYSRANFRK